jgi:hypothetical protein
MRNEDIVAKSGVLIRNLREGKAMTKPRQKPEPRTNRYEIGMLLSRPLRLVLSRAGQTSKQF